MNKSLTNLFTYACISIIIIYIIYGLMKYYGVSSNQYNIYLYFYIFLFISVFILGEKKM